MNVHAAKPRKKPTKIEEMTKEQLRQAIIKKRECNTKAQLIVESLLEKTIQEEYFVKCLPEINQAHFEDVIEERSILHFCGYPLCDKTISEKDIPKQKYKISTKTNKVYDITVRKSFCSNSCYKSAMHIKKQMLTSPLWFREYEEIPNFYLLPLDSVGSLGQEVDLSYTEKIDLSSEKQSFTSVKDFARASLAEMPSENNNSFNANEDAKNISHKAETPCKKDFTKGTDTTKISEENNSTKEYTELSRKPSTQNPLNIVGEIIEKPQKKIDPILLYAPSNNNEKSQPVTKKPEKKQQTITAITIEVEKCLAEWFSLDTMLFLFGQDKVKEMVGDKGECIKEYLNNFANGLFYKANLYDQYQELCRKLNMLELEDQRYDNQALAKETKPLPNYSVLQEESMKMQLKVKAFYAGETVIPKVETSTTNTTDDDGNTPQIPLVDKHAQNALRRRIVFQHLNKVLPDLLRSLGLLTLSISSDIRLLVNTLRLKATNIMFKPIQWTLIAIVFIKLLSLRDPRLEDLLNQPTAFQHMQLLLLSYKQDGGYLDRLVLWLTDIDRLLDTNDTQLTVG